jgi:hypothetical protein
MQATREVQGRPTTQMSLHWVFPLPVYLLIWSQLSSAQLSSVSMATGYVLDSRAGQGSRPVLWPIWSPIQCIVGVFRVGGGGWWWSDRGVKLTIPLRLVLMSRTVDLYIHSPMRLLDMELKQWSTRTSLHSTYSLLQVPSVMQRQLIGSHFTSQHRGCLCTRGYKTN